MTLNCIWWSGTRFRDLGSVEYPFIAITPRSTLTRSGSTCSGPILGTCAKKKKILRPDLVLVEKKRTLQLVEFTILADHRLKVRETKKLKKYLNLAREQKKSPPPWTSCDWVFLYLLLVCCIFPFLDWLLC